MSEHLHVEAYNCTSLFSSAYSHVVQLIPPQQHPKTPSSISYLLDISWMSHLTLFVLISSVKLDQMTAIFRDQDPETALEANIDENMKGSYPMDEVYNVSVIARLSIHFTFYVHIEAKRSDK
jgi:hypothetical protein